MLKKEMFLHSRGKNKIPLRKKGALSYMNIEAAYFSDNFTGKGEYTTHILSF